MAWAAVVHIDALALLKTADATQRSNPMSETDYVGEFVGLVKGQNLYFDHDGIIEMFRRRDAAKDAEIERLREQLRKCAEADKKNRAYTFWSEYQEAKEALARLVEAAHDVLSAKNMPLLEARDKFIATLTAAENVLGRRNESN